MAGPPRLFRSRLVEFVDVFLPDPPISETQRRRMRAVVVGALVTIPFGLIATQQIYEYIGLRDSLYALAGLLMLLACPMLLRTTRSATLPGLVQAFSLLGLLFMMAMLDGGLDDPSLYWVPLIPMAAAVTIGPLGIATTLVASIAGVLVLYMLTLEGYAFPDYSSGLVRSWFDMFALCTGACFAALVGGLYERHTRHELSRLSEGVRGLQGELGRSEERYQALFEHLPIGMYRTTPSGEVVLANDAFLRMLGYRSLREFQHERERVSATYADPSVRGDLVQRLRQFGQVSQYELDLRARDGRLVHVRVNARTVADEHGRPRFFEGTVEDVTAHRDAQERLRRSEERFRALVRHSSDIIAVLDEDGRMGYVSPALLPMLGRHPEETTGQTYHSILHPDECRRVGVLFRHALRRRGALPTVEVRLRHASGHYLFVEVTGTNRLGDAHLSGLILNVRDITDRKRAETVLRKSKEHAEEVAQFKSSFLANMSHEIRTPLTGILGFSSVLAEEVTDEHHREFVRLISKSGHRLLDTLNSVLDLARLEAGRMELEAESMRVGEAVSEGVALLVPLAEEKGLALNVEVTAPDACALLDPGALSRIINNLVGNAIKFTERGEVCVLVEDQAGLVRIRVRDTGPGIDEAFLPRIFSEFEQASRGIGRDHEGSGLGLTITQRLVEKLGGAIEVKSVLGTGTTFTVTFPRTDVPAPAMPEPALPQTEAVAVSVAQPHVLVVDDNQQTRFLMERMLRANFQVDTAASAEEAYQRTDAHAYDAILLDINLGANASGEDVMRHLRSQDRYATTPIVAFTAYALPGDRERFLNQGFDGYLSKPFTRKQLGALMDAMLPGAMQTTESETPSLLLGPYAPRPTAGRETPTSQHGAPAWQPLDLQTAPDGDA